MAQYLENDLVEPFRTKSKQSGIMAIVKSLSKETLGWALYDWANSAFATTVMAGFFPIFFKEFWNSGVNVNVSTARLGFGNAFASLIVALVAPVLGAAADYGNSRKKFLLLFAYLGSLFTGLLFVIPAGSWFVAISVYFIAVVGFSGANVFYDSLLPFVSLSTTSDFVSGLGYSLGYLGGGILFLINTMMVLHPASIGLSNSATAVRFSFLSVAIWWGLFTFFTAIWVPEPQERLPLAPLKDKSVFRLGFQQVLSTLKKIRKSRNIVLFLIAYWLYIEGVDTIVRMAVDYGLSLGFDTKILITALLITQFVGFPATLGFSKLSEFFGTKQTILFAIFMYAFITVWGVFMRKSVEFYVLAILIGLVQGGIQALSRSFYSRLIPKERSGEYFGFYNMLGKFAAIIGPALVGISVLGAREILLMTGYYNGNLPKVGELASRWGIGSLLLLFIAGAALLLYVKEPEE